MRASLLVLVLVLSIFISEAQGIRLNKEYVSFENHKVHEGTLIKANINGGVGEVILCKDGKCSGNSRKLMTKTISSTSSTTTTSKNGKNGGGKADDPVAKGKSGNEHPGGREEENFSVNYSPVTYHREAAPEGYPDILDLAEMDYSPARRKPPIHN